MFISELNGLILMQGDIGNAYLESYTNEQVNFIASPEFGPREGHTLIIIKALYGLHSCELWSHDKIVDTLCTMGFTPTYANHDIGYNPLSTCTTMSSSMWMTYLLPCVTLNTFLMNSKWPCGITN